jgi:hypothetical protein
MIGIVILRLTDVVFGLLETLACGVHSKKHLLRFPSANHSTRKHLSRSNPAIREAEGVYAVVLNPVRVKQRKTDQQWKKD